MEGLTDCRGPVDGRLHKRLRDVVRVHVVQCLPAQIRQTDLPAGCQIRKHRRIEVCRRIQRNPTRPHQVARVQHRRRKAMTRASASRYASISAFRIP